MENEKIDFHLLSDEKLLLMESLPWLKMARDPNDIETKKMGISALHMIKQEIRRRKLEKIYK